MRFEKYDLVVCDEFGYISFDKQGAELLFNHLSLRAGRKSTIVTKFCVFLFTENCALLFTDYTPIKILDNVKFNCY